MIRTIVRKDYSLLVISIKQFLCYRTKCFARLLSNIFMVITLFYLWKTIYAENPALSERLPFEVAFSYIVLSTCLNNIFRTSIVYDNSDALISGNIVTHLVKPYNYYNFTIKKAMGSNLMMIILVGVPTLFMLCFQFNCKIHTGDLFVFVLSFLLGMLISINIDYLTSLIAFKTESVWGVEVLKEALIMAFSGLVIPISLYPEWFSRIIKFTPFIAIYYIPSDLLLNKNSIKGILINLLVQLLWIIMFKYINKALTRRLICEIKSYGG